MKKSIYILFSLQLIIIISYAECNGLAVVDQLNGLTATSAINISEQKFERKLLTIKDMLVREIDIKSCSILFYLYDDGTGREKNHC